MGYEIFLLIGQSNMAGRGQLEEVPPLSHEHIRMFRDGEWRPAREPLHRDKPEIAGVGLGMSFAFAQVERDPRARIGLLPCAVGGTRLERWVPGADLYRQAVTVARQALPSGRLRGILWHQGEGDASELERATTYGARLAGMVEALRRDLHAPEAPFVAGELGTFLSRREPPLPHWECVNEQIRALCDRLPRFACAGAEGLSDNGDALHFNSASLREFGRRYALEFERLARRG